LFFAVTGFLQAQYWQQKVDYKMYVDMDVNTYQYNGSQKVTYKNNSPETLLKVYYHLYNNAFKPGSEMDIKVQNTLDPDERLVVNIGTESNPVKKSKIALLKPENQGFMKVKSLRQKGKPLKYKVEGTILEVLLNKPIKPGKKTVLEMEFLGQLPQQIRRSGRNNKEGVELSMTQWYPKLAAYDEEGWHANPYLGAEFYADWGDYEVDITIDKSYTIGGTGYLKNSQEVGHGYENLNKPLKQKVLNGKITWKFSAPKVHDFSWAADANYKHFSHQVPNGPKVFFLHKKTLDQEKQDSWQKLPKIMDKLFAFYNAKIGTYPYKQYSVIQGGDGGMEYAMCTLITGNRSYGSLVGVVAHELAHSWFQFLLATNETKYAWLDEGFTTYISTIAESIVLGQPLKNKFNRMYLSYLNLVEYKLEQPLTTHGDAFDLSYGYGVSSYNKGALFLHQLAYIIGEDVLERSFKKYFKEYAFRHPKPTDFIRIAEKIAEMELDWYYNYFVETTKSIDYEVKSIVDKTITLKRKGKIPMPIEVSVTYKDGTQDFFYIPLDIMRGYKKSKASVLNDWMWVEPEYKIMAKKPIKKVIIDVQNKMMDIDRVNNILQDN